jgi:uncharacterized protein
MTTRALPRPIASPLPLGMAGLAGASLVTSGSELGWISSGDAKQVALVLLAFAFPLQVGASLIAFLGHDGVLGTTLGVLACTWLSDGLIHMTTPPAARNGALGLLFLATAAVVGAGSAAAASARRAPAFVFAIAAMRFALLGVYNLGASAGWQDVGGAVGLAVVVAASWGLQRQL